MRVDGNYGSTLGYQPNSLWEWDEQPEYKEPPLEIKGAMDSYEPKDEQTDDTFYQAGDLYRLITEDKKLLLIENTARNIGPASENIKYRHTAHCYLADKDYGTRLAKALGLELAKVTQLAAMSHKERMKATAMK
jgi:catalase